MLPVETLASELVDKIEEAGDGYSIRLTRLVDGEAEYTLFYDGVETTHSSYEEAADYFQSIIRKEKIEIATAAIAAWNTRPTSSAEDEVARLRKALEWYANPEVYAPHPHGPAFDRRDLSWRAKAALGDEHDA